MHKSIVAALILTSCLVACGGGSEPVQKINTAIVVGDSITMRTGLCSSTDTLQSCIAAGRNSPETAYSTYLKNIKVNLGRGGDTCTKQETYPSGPFAGKSRGLLYRLPEIYTYDSQQVLVLIGINDINGYLVPIPEVIDCIRQVWYDIKNHNLQPIALTYPKIKINAIWDLASVERTVQLNAAIRSATALDKIKLADLEPIAYTSVDGVHPSQEDAREIAKLIETTLN